MIALLGFILETFWTKKKKKPHGKGIFGGKDFKNSSRYIVCKNTFSWPQASLNQVDLIFWQNTHSVKTLHSWLASQDHRVIPVGSWWMIHVFEYLRGLPLPENGTRLACGAND